MSKTVLLPTTVSDEILRVVTLGDLPANVPEGSVRYVDDADAIYKYDGAAWTSTGGGGGGSVDAVFGRTGVVTAAAGDYDITEITGTANGLAGFDGSGLGRAVPGYSFDATDLGLSSTLTVVPVQSGGTFKQQHTQYTAFNPAVADADDNWYLQFIEASVGDDNSGNQLGDLTNGGLTTLGVNARSINESSVGNLAAVWTGVSLGNGTDAIVARDLTAHNINLSMANNTACENLYGANISYSTGGTACVVNQNAYGLNFGGTVEEVGNGAYGVNFSVVFPDVASFNGFNLSTQLTDVASSVIAFSDFCTQPSGSIGNYTSAALQPDLSTIAGGFTGIYISPTVDSCQFATGLTINMQDVTSAGTVRALECFGDVSITGGLQISGAFAPSQLQAFYSTNPVDGGGAPLNMQSLTTGLTALDGVTTANADAIGVNTAMLIELQEDSVCTSGAFQLGFTALALPCVVQTHTNATLDFMSAATYAVNFDGGSTGGTIDTVRLCRAVAIPNGITTVNRMMGYFYHEPFGGIGTTRWGVYMEDAPHNWFENGVKIGGTAGSSDTVSSTEVGLELQGKVVAFAPYTTTERDALTPSPGWTIYNSTTGAIETYNGSTWV
jgi:hypothetical protein